GRDRLHELLETPLALRLELPVEGVLQDQPGGEGADDRREPDPGGGPREEEAEREARREENAARPQPRGAVEDRGREPRAEPERRPEEDGRLREGREERPPRDAPARVRRGDDPGDGGEDDQPLHVVDDGRAEDDARLGGVEAAEVLEDARRDPDAGRAE